VLSTGTHGSMILLCQNVSGRSGGKRRRGETFTIPERPSSHMTNTSQPGIRNLPLFHFLLTSHHLRPCRLPTNYEKRSTLRWLTRRRTFVPPGPLDVIIIDF